MSKTQLPNKGSAFESQGFKKTLAQLFEQISDLYLADEIPWVIGYSGGKDSTATLQAVWIALSLLPEDKRTKPVHVISTDTLVENPVVAAWVSRSLVRMSEEAKRRNIPISSHRLTPPINNTFWVNLIGKGYPAPRPKFRWCTERLKINPATDFIRNVVQSHGEAILVLGTRKAESIVRAKVMERFEKQRIRDFLSPNGSLPNSYVYTPIESWSNDDVWLFLMQVENPWGYNNKDLLTMYQGASADGECPLVVDTSTPSCGDSRFGCWVCTMVDKDRSMQAMIQNDEEKEWMHPLLKLRDELDVADDRHLRDFRRMNGSVQLFHDRPIPGPYTQEARENWLKRVLETQRFVRRNGPAIARDIELITLTELEEIRRLWMIDKHEIEDNLPRIYMDVMAEPYPGREIEDNNPFGHNEISMLKETCKEDRLHFELLRELLAVEKRNQSVLRRRAIFEDIEKAFIRSGYDSADEAINRVRLKNAALAEAQSTLEEVIDPDLYLKDEASEGSK
jgi:DNA sulfur modification protein DndC